MSKVTRDELLEALTGFRLSVRTPRGYQEGGEIANPETVADVLYATLSRIAAERAPDLGEADDLTSALDQIRERGYRNGATGAECARLSDSAAEDVPLLLAAIERVLELTEPTGEVHRDLDGNEEHGVVRVVRCDVLREAIRAELTKGEGGDGS